MSCPICEKRPPKRFCPAKGEKICALCCGQHREITIDCPHDCPHLLAARRWEAEHPKPIAREDFPYPDVEFSPQFIYERWPVVAGIAGTILGLAAEDKELNDAAALAALESLAETYRTLGAGIYYERPPALPVAHELYARIVKFLEDYRKSEAERSAFSALKDSDLFLLILFHLRMGKQRGNGRSRSRAFLDFLRITFPISPAAAKEESRIIVP
jgi:hypothetical protein